MKKIIEKTNWDLVEKANIGIIGGSGLYSLLHDYKDVKINTKYGKTSDNIKIGFINKKKIAFIPRHSIKHNIAPMNVPYFANIEAFDKLNIKRIIATNAVGSLNLKYKPGDFVLFDQFINMTNRQDTFFNKSKIVHISSAEPYCNELRDIAYKVAIKMKIKIHNKSNVIIVNGPRFSTKAESKFFRSIGGDIINMTQYPEVVLAKEKTMCYLGIGIITDYDAGIYKNTTPVSAREINEIFDKSISKLKQFIFNIINEIPENRNCSCKNALDNAEMKK